MLGRKDYSREEVDRSKSNIGRLLAQYRELSASVGTKSSPKASVVALEPELFNTLVLALDRPFVHRVRSVAGKDGNALNEVEVVCDSLILHQGILTASTVLKVDPSTSVLGLAFGETIALTVDQFEALSTAFFAELERRFLS